ncbi:MAG: hypothetical protein FE78DRAFT_542974, partial [Acidomyces sp. 'richmondensis']
NSYAYKWLTTVFELSTKLANPRHRRLLIIDSYRSYITANVIAHYIEHAIDLLILLLYMLYILQPLNVSLLSPISILKKLLMQLALQPSEQDNTKQLTSLNLSLLLSDLLDSTELRQANALCNSKNLLTSVKRYITRLA